MDRDLKLNSINRYVKSSPRFVLEEHGHCEVPAGCGGVILRWRDPRHEIPVRMEVAVVCAVSRTVRIDGAEPVTSRPLLAPGPHELTIDIVAAEDATAQLLFIARVGYSPDAEPLLITGENQPWEWAALEEPSAGDWRPLVRAELPAGEDDGYAVRRLLRAGAEPLTTPGRVPQLRVRASFELSAGE